MFHRKHSQAVGDHGAAGYSAVPAGGTANYPADQRVGHGYEVGNDVNVKQTSGFGYDNDVRGHHHHQHGEGGYVQHQQTPVRYGPDGRPIEAYPKKKSNRAANWCAAAFVACWACTWPCHGPCCCGV